MSSSALLHRPPSRNGVGASCVCLPQGPWLLLLDFLCERFNAISREVWQERMQRGLVINAEGIAVPPDGRFTPLGRVFYYRELPMETPIPFEARILFEDDHLVVVDKPHFLPVMPSGQYLQETLLVRLKRQLGIDTLVPVHRIDRDTAGLVLFSKRPASRNLYHALFRKRELEKLYECLAPWRPGLALPTTRSSRIVEASHFMLQHEVAGQPNAITHISVLQSPAPKDLTVARYALRPITGKRHQLRVHMAALGIPIVGDGLYPELTPQGQIDYARPLQLLAKRLAFVDPLSGTNREFESGFELQAGNLGAAELRD